MKKSYRENMIAQAWKELLDQYDACSDGVKSYEKYRQYIDTNTYKCINDNRQNLYNNMKVPGSIHSVSYYIDGLVAQQMNREPGEGRMTLGFTIHDKGKYTCSVAIDLNGFEYTYEIIDVVREDIKEY